MASDRIERCPFCGSQIEAHVLERCGTVVAIADRNPVTEGHVLIVPRRHTPDFFSMTDEEKTGRGPPDPTPARADSGVGCDGDRFQHRGQLRRQRRADDPARAHPPHSAARGRCSPTARWRARRDPGATDLSRALTELGEGYPA